MTYKLSKHQQQMKQWGLLSDESLPQFETRYEHYKANKVHLMNAIHGLGIQEIEVEFEGSGDSGGIESVIAKGEVIESTQERREIDMETVVPALISGHTVLGPDGFAKEPMKDTGTLEQLIREVVEYDLDNCGVDYVNNSGGFGHWKYDADEGFDFEVYYRTEEEHLGHSNSVETLHEWIQVEGEF